MTDPLAGPRAIKLARLCGPRAIELARLREEARKRKEWADNTHRASLRRPYIDGGVL